VQRAGGDLWEDRCRDGGVDCGADGVVDDLRYVQGGGSGDGDDGCAGVGEAWGGVGGLDGVSGLRKIAMPLKQQHPDSLAKIGVLRSYGGTRCAFPPYASYQNYLHEPGKYFGSMVPAAHLNEPT